MNAVYGLSGNAWLRDRAKKFNQAARQMPIILLTDLDKVECAPSLIRSWIGGAPSSGLLFRVAVREAEAWVLAHRKAFSEFLGIPEAKLPPDADALENPKEFLLHLARSSGKKELRQGLLPKDGSMAKIGPSYNLLMGEFVRTHWKAREAARHSESLRRTWNRIREFKPVLPSRGAKPRAAR